MKDWKLNKINDGIMEVKTTGWPSFQNFVNHYKREMKNYIWRGHCRSDWLIIPSLDRVLQRFPQKEHDKIRRVLLERFRFSTRGRRGTNPKPLTENEWWALGRHFGLITPLLDWTTSPFIAAFFAFYESEKSKTGYRSVSVLSAKTVRAKSDSLIKRNKCTENDIIRFVSPLTDDNSRLIHQRGLFSRAPDGMDIETWVRKYFKGYKGKTWILAKILIPDSSRVSFLQSLERMAITPMELFPDLSGASLYCNLSIEIKDYCHELCNRDMWYSSKY